MGSGIITSTLGIIRLLGLLASGQHECLQHMHKGSVSQHGTPNSSLQAQQGQQQQTIQQYTTQTNTSPLAMLGNYVTGDMYMSQ